MSRWELSIFPSANRHVVAAAHQYGFHATTVNEEVRKGSSYTYEYYEYATLSLVLLRNDSPKFGQYFDIAFASLIGVWCTTARRHRGRRFRHTRVTAIVNVIRPFRVMYAT